MFCYAKLYPVFPKTNAFSGMKENGKAKMLIINKKEQKKTGFTPAVRKANVWKGSSYRAFLVKKVGCKILLMSALKK